MTDPIQIINGYILNQDQQDNEQRRVVEKSVADLARELNNLQFKVDRLNHVKETLTIMLEESVAELEKKSNALEEANRQLSATLGDLQRYAKEVERQKKQVEFEQQRSDQLLQNILPAEIVAELKTYGRSFARKYDEVTVFFADIKDFSSIAEKLQPDELVTHLDDYFRGFDHIIEKYGMEKIKTIGDAYMCVSGLFNKEQDHAISAVRAAIDIQNFIANFSESKKIQGLPAFSFRIGIHSGPVVAGVIGARKFAYDIWGDTVNLAARMEQHGEPRRINISASTYELIKDHFTCLQRPPATLKNGRLAEMYFIE